MFRTQLGKSLVIGWWLLAAVLLFALFWTIRNAAAESSPKSVNNHLVTIYDRGEERTIVTTAKTVRDALKEAGVTVNDIDITEPKLDSEMGGEQYNINVYRARPVVVEDGSARTRVMTAAQSPSSIVAATGEKLYDEDRTTLKRVDDVIADGGPGLKLSVDRATVFTLVLYGKPIEARTQATTVGEMLDAKGIKLGPKDGVSLPDSTPITAGLNVSVWRNGVQTVTLEEAVEMPVRQVKDMEKEIGFKQVQTAGKPGKKQVTYEINTQNGREVGRKVIQSVISEQPTEQVEVVGAKAKVITGSCGEWLAAAGISATANTMYLINKESHCNPNALNRSSGACGIPQALPCSKMGPVNADGTSGADPVTQLKWMNGYVMGRYGSWDAAAAHSRAKGWY